MPKSLYILLTLLYTLGLVFVSLTRINSPALDPVNFKHADKIFHFTAYFGLTILWKLLLYKKKNKKIFNLKINIYLIAIIFGIVIEILQYRLTDYRSFDFFDILANTMGVFSAYIVIKYFNLFKKLKF